MRPGKGCVIVVNKWDAVEKDDKTMQEYRKNLKWIFFFLCLMLRLYLYQPIQVKELTDCLS